MFHLRIYVALQIQSVIIQKLKFSIRKNAVTTISTFVVRIKKTNASLYKSYIQHFSGGSHIQLKNVKSILRSPLLLNCMYLFYVWIISSSHKLFEISTFPASLTFFNGQIFHFRKHKSAASSATLVLIVCSL